MSFEIGKIDGFKPNTQKKTLDVSNSVMVQNGQNSLFVATTQANASPIPPQGCGGQLNCVA